MVLSLARKRRHCRKCAPWVYLILKILEVLTHHITCLFTHSLTLSLLSIPGNSTAVTARPRDCTMCRECTRHDGWSNKVNLRRIGILRLLAQLFSYLLAHSLTHTLADHYIFTVESAGSMAPEQIIHHAIEVLKEKATKFIVEVEHVM